MLNSVFRYFDLQFKIRSVTPQGTSGQSTYAPVLPQYLAASAGVIVEPLLRGYINTGAWQYGISALAGRVVFGLIVGIVLLPAIYKSADRCGHLAVQASCYRQRHRFR